MLDNKKDKNTSIREKMYTGNTEDAAENTFMVDGPNGNKVCDYV